MFFSLFLAFAGRALTVTGLVPNFWHSISVDWASSQSLPLDIKSRHVLGEQKIPTEAD